MRLVDGLGVAEFLQRLLRHDGDGAGGGDQHGVGIGRENLQRLRVDAGVGALEALDVEDVDAALLRRRLGRGQPALAVPVGVADEGDGLDAVRLHVIEHGGGHDGVVLRGLEHPATLVVERPDGRLGRHHGAIGRLGLGRDVDQREGRGRRRRADQKVDVVLGDEFARIGDRLGRIGRVVEQGVFDRLAVDLLGQLRDRVLLRNAERRRRPGLGDDDSDMDLRVGRSRQERRRQRDAPSIRPVAPAKAGVQSLRAAVSGKGRGFAA